MTVASVMPEREILLAGIEAPAGNLQHPEPARANAPLRQRLRPRRPPSRRDFAKRRVGGTVVHRIILDLRAARGSARRRPAVRTAAPAGLRQRERRAQAQALQHADVGHRLLRGRQFVGPLLLRCW